MKNRGNKNLKIVKSSHKVTVDDSIMGSGKTINALKRMKYYLKNNKKFIYVTPFIKEIERAKSELGVDSISTPSVYNDFTGYKDSPSDLDILTFFEKKYALLNKTDHFKLLITKNKSIATTHALFTSLKASDSDLFKGYILIIDEAINPVTTFNFGARDISILFNEKLITIDTSTNKIIATDNTYKDESFKIVLNFCRQDNVYLINNTFVSLYPVELLNSFKKIEVLTYLFDSSIMSYYFKLYNIPYHVLESVHEDKVKEDIKNKLFIYEGEKNQSPRSKITSYSKTHLSKLSKGDIKKIKEATTYVFRYKFNTPSSLNAFTTFKDLQDKFSARGYTKGFIPVNARATNEFKDIESMAYLANRYLNPAITNFFLYRGITIDQEKWALSELIQWIWRGCIREREAMNLYIPSIRMRSLLIKWLDNKL